MPVFAYKGYTTVGKSVSNTKEAENERAVKALLRRDGIFVTDLRLTGSKQGKAKAGQGALARRCRS